MDVPETITAPMLPLSSSASPVQHDEEDERGGRREVVASYKEEGVVEEEGERSKGSTAVMTESAKIEESVAANTSSSGGLQSKNLQQKTTERQHMKKAEEKEVENSSSHHHHDRKDNTGDHNNVSEKSVLSDQDAEEGEQQHLVGDNDTEKDEEKEIEGDKGRDGALGNSKEVKNTQEHSSQGPKTGQGIDNDASDQDPPQQPLRPQQQRSSEMLCAGTIRTAMTTSAKIAASSAAAVVGSAREPKDIFEDSLISDPMLLPQPLISSSETHRREQQQQQQQQTTMQFVSHDYLRQMGGSQPMGGSFHSASVGSLSTGSRPMTVGPAPLPPVTAVMLGKSSSSSFHTGLSVEIPDSNWLTNTTTSTMGAGGLMRNTNVGTGTSVSPATLSGATPPPFLPSQSPSCTLPSPQRTPSSSILPRRVREGGGPAADPLSLDIPGQQGEGKASVSSHSTSGVCYTTTKLGEAAATALDATAAAVGGEELGGTVSPKQLAYDLPATLASAAAAAAEQGGGGGTTHASAMLARSSMQSSNIQPFAGSVSGGSASVMTTATTLSHPSLQLQHQHRNTNNTATTTTTNTSVVGGQLTTTPHAPTFDTASPNQVLSPADSFHGGVTCTSDDGNRSAGTGTSPSHGGTSETQHFLSPVTDLLTSPTGTVQTATTGLMSNFGSTHQLVRSMKSPTSVMSSPMDVEDATAFVESLAQVVVPVAPPNPVDLVGPTTTTHHHGKKTSPTTVTTTTTSPPVAPPVRVSHQPYKGVNTTMNSGAAAAMVVSSSAQKGRGNTAAAAPAAAAELPIRQEHPQDLTVAATSTTTTTTTRGGGGLVSRRPQITIQTHFDEEEVVHLPQSSERGQRRKNMSISTDRKCVRDGNRHTSSQQQSSSSPNNDKKSDPRHHHRHQSSRHSSTHQDMAAANTDAGGPSSHTRLSAAALMQVNAHVHAPSVSHYFQLGGGGGGQQQLDNPHQHHPQQGNPLHHLSPWGERGGLTANSGVANSSRKNSNPFAHITTATRDGMRGESSTRPSHQQHQHGGVGGTNYAAGGAAGSVPYPVGDVTAAASVALPIDHRQMSLSVTDITQGEANRKRRQQQVHQQHQLQNSGEDGATESTGGKTQRNSHQFAPHAAEGPSTTHPQQQQKRQERRPRTVAVAGAPIVGAAASNREAVMHESYDSTTTSTSATLTSTAASTTPATATTTATMTTMTLTPIFDTSPGLPSLSLSPGVAATATAAAEPHRENEVQQPKERAEQQEAAAAGGLRGTTNSVSIKNMQYDTNTPGNTATQNSGCAVEQLQQHATTAVQPQRPRGEMIATSAVAMVVSPSIKNNSINNNQVTPTASSSSAVAMPLNNNNMPTSSASSPPPIGGNHSAGSSRNHSQSLLSLLSSPTAAAAAAAQQFQLQQHLSNVSTAYSGGGGGSGPQSPFAAYNYYYQHHHHQQPTHQQTAGATILSHHVFGATNTNTVNGGGSGPLSSGPTTGGLLSSGPSPNQLFSNLGSPISDLSAAEREMVNRYYTQQHQQLHGGTAAAAPGALQQQLSMSDRTSTTHSNQTSNVMSSELMSIGCMSGALTSFNSNPTPAGSSGPNSGCLFPGGGGPPWGGGSAGGSGGSVLSSGSMLHFHAHHHHNSQLSQQLWQQAAAQQHPHGAAQHGSPLPLTTAVTSSGVASSLPTTRSTASESLSLRSVPGGLVPHNLYGADQPVGGQHHHHHHHHQQQQQHLQQSGSSGFMYSPSSSSGHQQPQQLGRTSNSATTTSTPISGGSGMRVPLPSLVGGEAVPQQQQQQHTDPAANVSARGDDEQEEGGGGGTTATTKNTTGSGIRWTNTRKGQGSGIFRYQSASPFGGGGGRRQTEKFTDGMSGSLGPELFATSQPSVNSVFHAHLPLSYGSSAVAPPALASGVVPEGGGCLPPHTQQQQQQLLLQYRQPQALSSAATVSMHPPPPSHRGGGGSRSSGRGVPKRNIHLPNFGVRFISSPEASPLEAGGDGGEVTIGMMNNRHGHARRRSSGGKSDVSLPIEEEEEEGEQYREAAPLVQRIGVDTANSSVGVVSWLRSYGHEALALAFQTDGFSDLYAVSHLTEEDLKRMKVLTGTRRKLLAGVEHLRAQFEAIEAGRQQQSDGVVIGTGSPDKWNEAVGGRSVHSMHSSNLRDGQLSQHHHHHPRYYHQPRRDIRRKSSALSLSHASMKSDSVGFMNIPTFPGEGRNDLNNNDTHSGAEGASITATTTLTAAEGVAITMPMAAAAETLMMTAATSTTTTAGASAAQEE